MGYKLGKIITNRGMYCRSRKEYYILGQGLQVGAENISLP